MPLQAVESRRLYRQIADQLAALIERGEYAVGSRLPPERDLAKQLRVSRPSVREALIALEIEGKVEVRVGAGVFVVAPKPKAVMEPANEGEGPFELLGARRVVEGETAAWAAREAEDADIAEIRAAVDELANLKNDDHGCDPADRNFHLAIARATHNGPLLSVIVHLWDQGRGAMWRQMEKHFETPTLRAATLRDHRAILKAIEAHDPRDARAAMHKHLDRVARDYGHGWDLVKERRGKKAASTRRVGGQ